MDLFHSSRTELDMDSLDDAPLCVTDDADASMEYAPGGHLYRVRLRGDLRVASASDVAELASELHPGHPYSRTWEQLEQLGGLMDAVLADYDAVSYQDATPNERTSHDTVMVFDARDCVVELTELEP